MTAYLLTYFYLGEEKYHKINMGIINQSLMGYVKDYIYTHTSDPDTVFNVTNRKGDIIFTEEDFEN